MWTNERIASIARHLLTAVGAAVAGTAFSNYFTADNITAAVGVIGAIGAALAGFLSKPADPKV